MSARTYYVGNTSIVSRLDNIDGAPTAWITKALPYASNLFLTDVKTDPNDKDKVFITGLVNNTGTPFRGIAFSLDAGDTWVTPNGNYQATIALYTNFRFNKIWVVNSNVIYIVGSFGIAVKSTDGGSTFNVVGALPGSLLGFEIQSVHFINELVGVIGVYDHVLKTINSGATWAIQSGGPITTAGNINGIYLSTDQQTIIANGSSRLYKSTDGGASFVAKYIWSSAPSNHLTWFKSGTTSIFWSLGNNQQIIKSLDEGETWNVISPYNPSPTSYDYKGGHHYNTQNGFYAANSISQFGVQYVQSGLFPSYTFPGNLDSLTKGVIAVWTHITPSTCYKLTNCITGAYYTTRTDISAYIGTTVTFKTPSSAISDPPLYVSVPGCYDVTTTDFCGAPIEVLITNSYNNCGACSLSCYLLINCNDSNDYIISSDGSLSDYLGEYVQLEDCDDKCYYVTLSVNCTGASEEAIVVLNSYVSCTECQGVEDVPEFNFNQRSITPGYYTPGCPPEYTLKINKKFGDQVFNEVAKLRFGITVCCDQDVDKWDIKKELLELKALYDPDFCICSSTTCDEPCNVTASILVIIPEINCPQPEEVTGGFEIEPDPCPDPTNDIDVTFAYGVG